MYLIDKNVVFGKVVIRELNFSNFSISQR